MKNCIKFISLSLLLILCLAGCAKEIELSTTPGSYVAIQHMGLELNITQTEDVEKLTNTVSTLQLKGTSPNPDEITSPVYTFTLYSNDAPTDSIQVFSKSLLQINNVYYSGSFQKLISQLESIVYATAPQEISEFINLTAKDIAEINLHHHGSKSYKIVTNEEEINKLLKPFSTIQSGDIANSETLTKQYSLYYRTKNQDEYSAPLHIGVSKNKKTQVICSESKILFAETPIDFTALFNQLSANQMPFNESK